MSDDVWDKKRKAHEEEFFQRQNKEALARLNAKKAEKPRICPVDGQEMKQMTHMAVVIDQCEKCRGVWLDGGELEMIIKATEQAGGDNSWYKGFFKQLILK